MEIQSAFNSGVAGFRNATELANESAANIAEQSVASTQNTATQNTNNQGAASSTVKLESGLAVQQTNEITEDLVNLRVAEHQALAAAKVISTADEVVGSLIDTRV